MPRTPMPRKILNRSDPDASRTPMPRGRITIWSISSAVIATTSVVPYHERRASGRRRASPGLVVMGSARLVSGLATRLRPEEGLQLSPGYVARWRELRGELERRRESRRQQRRFRHDPDAYLADLEKQCLQLSLPS